MDKIIFHVLNTGSFSGAENVVINIINEFTEQNIQGYRFIYVSLNGSIENRLVQENIEYIFIENMNIKEMRRIIKQYSPDIIHAHDYTASVISVLSSGSIPVISHIHNNSPWIRKICLRSILYGLSCLKYHIMLGVSNSVFKEFIFGGIFKNKEYIIGNPINIKKIQKKAEQATDNRSYDIVFLGRFSSVKNPFLFLDIISDICKKIHVNAVMIGDGELMDAIKAEIEHRNMKNIIVLKGFMQNPYGILKKSKILCIPSSWEGYGLAAVEALALGTPVICSNTGGLPDIIDDSCGKICNKKDEYVNEITDLLLNNDKLQMKQNFALEKAKLIDNIKKYMSELYKMYENIIN